MTESKSLFSKVIEYLKLAVKLANRVENLVVQLTQVTQALKKSQSEIVELRIQLADVKGKLEAAELKAANSAREVAQTEAKRVLDVELRDVVRRSSVSKEYLRSRMLRQTATARRLH